MAAASGSIAADAFALATDRDARSSGSLRTAAAAAAAASGNELQAAVAEAALALVMERAAAAAVLLRGLLHTADLVTVAPGGRHFHSVVFVAFVTFVAYNCYVVRCRLVGKRTASAGM